MPPATLTPAPPQQRCRGSELEALVRYPLRLSALSQSRGPRPHALFEFPRLKRTRARLRTTNPTRVSSRCSAPGGGICPAFGRHLTTRRLGSPPFAAFVYIYIYIIDLLTEGPTHLLVRGDRCAECLSKALPCRYRNLTRQTNHAQVRHRRARARRTDRDPAPAEACRVWLWAAPTPDARRRRTRPQHAPAAPTPIA